MNAILKSGKALVIDQFADYKAPGGTATISQILDQIAENWAQDYWDIGLLANIMLSQAKAKSLPVTDTNVYEAVAEMLRHEVSWNTVYYYARTESFFHDKDIDEFGAVPFSHFALAKDYHSDWYKVLSLSLDYSHHHAGRFPSRAYLQDAMAGRVYERQAERLRDGLPDQDEAYVQNMEDALEFDEMVSYSEDKPLDPVTFSSFAFGVRKFMGMMHRMKLLEHQRIRLESLLGELVDLLNEIVT